MTALKRRFKKKITTKGGKGQDEQKKANEEEARKREEDARRLAQEAESWLKSEEEGNNQAEEEVVKIVEEAARREEEERKKKEDEELTKQEAERLKLTGSMTEQQTSDPVDTQFQDLGNPDSQDPTTIAGSTLGHVVVSGLRLIPFKQKKGEEVLDFSTIFYDIERKRILKRTKKKVETGGQSGRMINDKIMFHGTDKDPRLTI